MPLRFRVLAVLGVLSATVAIARMLAVFLDDHESVDVIDSAFFLHLSAHIPSTCSKDQGIDQVDFLRRESWRINESLCLPVISTRARGMNIYPQLQRPTAGTHGSCDEGSG